MSTHLLVTVSTITQLNYGETKISVDKKKINNWFCRVPPYAHVHFHIFLLDKQVTLKEFTVRNIFKRHNYIIISQYVYPSDYGMVCKWQANPRDCYCKCSTYLDTWKLH